VLNDRKRIIGALCGIGLAITAGFVPGTANADPSINDVQAKVDALYHQAEKAQENYHDAQIQLSDLRRDLSDLRADQRRQDQRTGAARQQLTNAIVHQYQGDNLSALGQVIVSNNPGDFLGELSTMSSYNDLQTQLYTRYTTQAKALDLRTDATRKRLAQISDLQKQMAQDKKAVDSRLADAKALLGKLQAAQRAAMAPTAPSRSAVRFPAVAASGRAAAAVAFAKAQVGKPYVYGAAGPSAYDCSGLTMASWAQAGVGLPHSSSAQYSSGPHVSASQLQPGDLVFYYQPISHVGMYIGGGMIVHAANPSTGVTISGLYSMPFSGAVRPG
jgi:cell wall-associated NlpC family hydrolase